VAKTDGEKEGDCDEQRKISLHGTLHLLGNSFLVGESRYNISTDGRDVKGFCPFFYRKSWVG
jgi:hypothetical protein